MERVVFVPGERISLVIPEKEDLEVLYKGINNVNISKFLGPIKYYTKVQEEKFLESVLNGEYTLFVIMQNDTKEIIGGIGFNESSQNNRNGRMGISIYQESKFGEGYGTEALKLFLKYSFEYLGLNKVKLHVFSDNIRAIKTYEKCGFKKVGTLKEETYVMGEYKDEDVMEIMRNEYNS